jgi:hypothetical protein
MRIVDDCHHYWVPLYYPAERLSPSRPIPIAECSMCGEQMVYFGPGEVYEAQSEAEVKSMPQKAPCQHEWVDGTDGREMRSFFRCRKCHELFDGSMPKKADPT